MNEVYVYDLKNQIQLPFLLPVIKASESAIEANDTLEHPEGNYLVIKIVVASGNSNKLFTRISVIPL